MVSNYSTTLVEILKADDLFILDSLSKTALKIIFADVEIHKLKGLIYKFSESDKSTIRSSHDTLFSNKE